MAHAITPATTNWPLIGGIPSQLSLAENKGIERVYIGGYRDGTVRIWDATFPTLSFLYVLESEVSGALHSIKHITIILFILKNY